MKSDENLINEFREFATVIYEKYQPQDVTEIMPGMVNYKQSFLAHCFNMRTEINREFFEYVVAIEPELKTASDRQRIENEIFQISCNTIKEFNRKHIKGKSY